MIELTSVSLAALIGTLAGWFAVSIAVYLQTVYEQQCPRKYVAGFFLLGTGLIFANANGSVFALGVYEDWFPVFGNLTLVVAELLGFRHVIAELSQKGSESELTPFHAD